MQAEAARVFEQQVNLWARVTSSYDAFMSQFHLMIERLQMEEAVDDLIERNYTSVTLTRHFAFHRVHEWM